MTIKTNQFRDLIAASGQAPVAQVSANRTSTDQPAGRRRLGKRTAPDYVQVGVVHPKAAPQSRESFIDS